MIRILCYDYKMAKKEIPAVGGRQMRHHIKRTSLFYAVFLLLWMKTCLITYYGYQLRPETFTEQILHWISPGSSILIAILLGCYLLKNKQRGALVFIHWAYSTILFANLLYFRFFHDFITVPQLFQTNNFGSLGDSVTSLLMPADLLIFADALILTMIVYGFKWKTIRAFQFRMKEIKILTAAAVILLAFHITLIQWTNADRHAASASNRHVLVQTLGVFHYHLYDIVSLTFLHTKEVFADSTDLQSVKDYLNKRQSKHHQENIPLRGIAEGKNVVLVSLESLQSFVLGRSINGIEITPFLNELAKNSFYFDEFYQQTGQGKTSDSEFAVDTSLYPLPQGSVFYTQSDNEYEALPELLQQAGYATYVFHANDPEFWNRKEMYRTLGYERFFSADDFFITKTNQVGWGLKDKPFFKQAAAKMKELPQPFFSKLITLTNHHPYRLDDRDRTMAPLDTDDEIVNRYFATVRYMDEALKLFFDDMKANGLYENTIFILYGDHYGLSPANYEALGDILGRELSEYDHIRLQRVPLLIHVPGMEGKRLSTTAGHIDLKPTLRHLLNIESVTNIEFGQNLFDPGRRELAVLRDGSFVTEDLLYTNGACYDKHTGDPAPHERCEPYIDLVIEELHVSDKIIYEDLLRFEAAFR